jgi:hypothetical protein
MPVIIGATGLNFSVNPTEITLAGAQAYLIPSGQYWGQIGPYTAVEWYDSNAGLWRVQPSANSASRYIVSDGTNWRLINRTGCPVGAVITSAGSSYTSAPTVTASSGGSVWRAVVGGAINTTVTVTTGGAYNYVPSLVFSPPPAGGITATGYAVLSGGAINSVTVTNAGAGYSTAPTITVVQDPRDTAAGGATLTVNATLAQSGKITAVLCTDPGSVALTSTPTLTFTGGGGSAAAATVVMNYTVTGITVATGGAVYGNAQPFLVTSNGGVSTATPDSGDVNPAIEKGIIFPRPFIGSGTSTSAGAVTSTGFVIADAGYGFETTPNLFVVAGGSGLPTTTAQVTATVGATVDTSYLQPIRV